MSLNVGTVTAKFVADTTDWEARTARATEALKRVKTSAAESGAELLKSHEAARATSERLAQTQESVAKAVASVTARVDESRAKQLALADALLKAANAANRDEGHVRALRHELEREIATLNQLTGAQQRAGAASSGLHAATARGGGGMRNMGQATLELSRGLEDLQYGVSGVINNIPSLAMSLGAGAGVAGVASLAAVAVSQLVKHFGTVPNAASEAAKGAKSALADLKTEVQDLYDALNALGSGTTIKILSTERQIEETRAQGMAAVPEDRRAAFLAYAGSTKFRDEKVESIPEFAEARALLLKSFALQDTLAVLKNQKALEEINAAEEELKRDRVAGDKKEAKALGTDSAQEKADDALAALDVLATAAVEGTAVVLAAVGVNSALNAPIAGSDANALAGMDVAGDVIDLDAVEHAKELDAAFVAMHAEIAGGVVELQDFGDTLEKIAAYDFADAVRKSLSAVDWGGFLQQLASGNATGAFAEAGTQLATELGAAVSMALGDGTGVIGATVGALLGGILGNALGALVDALGILTPLFDAVAIVISAFTPIFMVIGELFTSMASVAPIVAILLLSLTRPIAALLLIFVRLIEIGQPLLNILMVGAVSLLQFLDVVTMGVKWLDDEFFRPMITSSRMLYNAFANLVNGVILWIRQLPGMDEFGTLIQTVNVNVDPLIDNFDGLNKQLDEMNAGESFANLPAGYRTALAMYDAETPRPSNGAPAGAVGGGVPRGPTYNFYGDLHVRDLSPGELERAQRKQNLSRYGRAVGGGGAGDGDDSNG